MTNSSTLKNDSKTAPEETSSITNDDTSDSVETSADQPKLTRDANRSRAPAQSKSEIMEELHRQRFPWEE
ncbi:hypothetical protein [Polynucleobacter sp. MWH-Braz-FAM2G]|uniref:hypothetical protein n=1 Tax=Polynucleobacter sp. MWH-Braz-FAM2G TaxID=1855883 RepID=UPI001BFEB476|nr:hypothetical protein [Polynucleobacter sp. MWH-Braz-FAM2G]QWD91666.1 hypothetical protein FD973_04890 [Polynucleobacter sp. MWH-Braz-FAM2G]